MNREQIETTPAGPELDRLVAEAKGWEYRHGTSRAWANEDGYWWVSPPGITTPVADTPRWSTDIAAAFAWLDEIFTTIEGEIDFNLGYTNSPAAYPAGWAADIIVDDEIVVCGYGNIKSEALTRACLLFELERAEADA